jgi:TonB family protein
MDPQRPTGVPSGSSKLVGEVAPRVDGGAPVFLLQLEPRGRGFLASVAALFQRNNTAPGNNGFWSDVTVATGLPRRSFAQSALLHLVTIAAIYGAAKLPRHHIELVAPHPDHQTLTYYRVADELPALQVAAERAPKARAADPAYAPQEVMSLPPAPERFRQRIIVPGAAKLNAEQRLPNIVAWNPTLPAPPVTGAEKLGPDLQLDRTHSVIAPAPEDIDRALGVMSIEVRAAVPPPAKDVAGWKVLDAPVRSAVGPAAQDSARDLRNDNDKFAALQRTAVAPAPRDAIPNFDALKLAVPRRLAVAAAPSDVAQPNRNSVLLPARVAVAPPSTDTGASISGGTKLAALMRGIVPPASGSAPAAGRSGESTAAQQGAGQMVVLGLNPVQPNGVIEIPNGNLNGSFAGSPRGNLSATGEPALIAGGNGAGGNSSAANNPLTGITIAGHTAANALPVVSSAAPASEATPAQPRVNAFAPIRRPTVADITRDISRDTSPGISPGARSADLFHSRRAYSMAVNMPNLNSVSGSWIIHFAELRGTPSSAPELVAPDMVLKADPAYPSDLMRQGVQGTVVLYAVIHSDGSVDSVRVMEGIDARLDHYAEVALAECRFRPATRNGQPVDLEAVVQIPFRSARLRP